MSRVKLPEGEGKVMFNSKLDREKLRKLRIIAFRKSVISCTKFSQADFIEEAVTKTRLPRKPTPAELAAYREKYPKAEHTEPTE
jgi:hypothetical protein